MRVCFFAAVAALLAFAGATSAMADRYQSRGESGWQRSSKSHVQRGQKAKRAYKSRSHYASRHTSRTHASRGHKRHYASAGRSARGHNGRPRKWCGWWMRQQRGGGPEYNLAANWKRYGRPSGPQVGAVVVWRHHVGEIVGRAANGQWIVRSGNDGGQVRTRARSVAGAVFRVG